MMLITIDASDLLRWARLFENLPAATNRTLADTLNYVGNNVADEVARYIADQNDLEPDDVRRLIDIQAARPNNLSWSMDASEAVLGGDEFSDRSFTGDTDQTFIQPELINLITAGDDAVCPICQEAADNNPYTTQQIQDMAAKWAGYQPPTPVTGERTNLLHPNAILEGSRIASYGLMNELVAAKFRGPAVRLTTNVGVMTIGPNHPMLTRRGFVKANQLTEGDELLYDLRSEVSFGDESSIGTFVSHSNFQQMPMIEDVFFTASQFGSKHVLATRNDLHSDAVFCENEIEIVRPARKLLPIFNPRGLQHICKLDFPRPYMKLFFKSGLCSFLLPLCRILLPSTRLVRGLGLRPTFSVSHVLPFDPFLLGLGALNSVEYRTEPLVTDMMFDTDRKHALARLVHINDKLFRWDRIRTVHLVDFLGMAFDASTVSGLYNCSGYVVKNCRCVTQGFRSMRRIPVNFQRSRSGGGTPDLMTLRQLSRAVRDNLQITIKALRDR